MAKRPASDPTKPLLPGDYLRTEVLRPRKMTVTAAAKVLGVGRPALSNFLNGNASVSPDMAARIERAFGIPAQQLLDMQTAASAAEAKLKGAATVTKAYVPPFLAPRANDIEEWATKTNSARSRLPVLLRMLVHSTGIDLTEVTFHGNDDAQRPGWDGHVIAGQGTPWIPQGESGWEFGVDHDVKGKADGDYTQRTKTTKQTDREQTTFVFVTPRRWHAKDRWAAARNAERKWKAVRVFDASNLEEWLEQSIASQTWFSCETHRPSSGTESLDHCWSVWANTSQPPLVPDFFESSVRATASVILKRLSAETPEPTVIAADSTEEALAFLSQVMNQDSGEGGLSLRDRAVVFRQTGTLPSLAEGRSNFIAIVPNRDVERELGPYSRKIPSVLVYPRNAVNTEPHVTLEPLNSDTFSKSLQAMNFSRDDIARLDRESGRSLTVLRRRLSNVPTIKSPNWSTNHSTSARLVPFLLAGTWNSTNQNDQVILSLLAGGASYASLEGDIQSLARLDDAPIWSVGTYRGVVSKIDALFAIHSAISNLKPFLDIAHLVLAEGDPALDLPVESQWAAALYGKTRDISASLRRSICETLVLLSVFGNALFQSRLGMDVEREIQVLIRRLLTPLTTRTLEDHERDLPMYAEAAPDEFLRILEDDLKTDAPATFGLMKPTDSGIFGRCPRAGLLWALENLAWSPSTIKRAVGILARLSEIPIDDNWSNKPIGSLESVFRSWMPQTAASVEQRISLLEALARKQPKVAWHICMQQISSHGVGHYSHKPQWRNEGQGAGEPVGENERRTFIRSAVDLSLKWKRHDRETLGDLVSKIRLLSPAHQGQVWQLVRDWAKSGVAEADKAWVREKIRITVLTRRGRKIAGDTASAITEAARDVIGTLEPKDQKWRHEWLFRQGWVEESADELEKDIDLAQRDKRITELRLNALRDIFESGGIADILTFAELGKAPFQIGWHATAALKNDDLEALLLAAIDGGLDSWTRRMVLNGALCSLPDDGRRGRMIEQLGCRISQSAFARVLAQAPFVGSTWRVVDGLEKTAQDLYWKEVDPTWNQQSEEDLNDAAKRLLNAGRPRASFQLIHIDLKKIRPKVLFDVLTAVATNNTEPAGQYRIDRWHISKAFERLDESGEFSIEQMAGLEFPYVEVLADDHGANKSRGVPNLERYLDQHPELFVDAIAWTYKRDDGAEDPEEYRLPDREMIKNRAHRGAMLLDNIRECPGRDQFGAVASDRLVLWIETVRAKSGTLGRLGVCDHAIGRLLSKVESGADGVWPCEPVRDALEKLQLDEVSAGIEIGLYNSRGAHWRADDGIQERDLARRYQTWADALEALHPFVAGIHRRMAQTYEREARMHDVESQVNRRLR